MNRRRRTTEADAEARRHAQREKLNQLHEKLTVIEILRLAILAM